MHSGGFKDFKKFFTRQDFAFLVEKKKKKKSWLPKKKKRGSHLYDVKVLKHYDDKSQFMIKEAEYILIGVGG